MKNLKEIRKKNNMTQAEVAKRLGISQQAYAQYENSEKVPNENVLMALAGLFNTTKEELMSNLNVYNTTENMTIEDFLGSSYSAYHSVKNIVTILEKNGFSRLYDFEKWELKSGSKHYIIKNNTAVIAFSIGDLSNYAFNIAECHTDSPCLKIKGNTLINGPLGKRIDVEGYGGVISYSMLDIPLKIAGRLLVKNGNSLNSKNVVSPFNVNIPSLCIHHNPGVNEGMSLNMQNDMLPLIGNVDDLYSLLAPNEEVIDSDLYVAPDVKPYYAGTKNEYLVSPRIDNLSSAYAIVKAIVNANPKGVSIGAFFDNEEIGSSTKQGARSAYLPDVLEKINRSLGYGADEYLTARRNGFVVSIDNGHSVHQAHPEKYDLNAYSKVGGGVVIKHHVNYATDGMSSAVVKSICKNNSIPFQDYYNRSDLRCGSTIGLMSSAQLEMNTCDIGIAQLAMHSAIETASMDDVKEMTKFVEAFFNTSLKMKEDEVIEL